MRTRDRHPPSTQDDVIEVTMEDLPSESKGKLRFFFLLLGIAVLIYPIVDPVLFGSGTAGRVAHVGDAGYYIILALGLNIVVGFAGLLDLGYVAFFAIGAYCWALVGSPQFGFLTGIRPDPVIWPWLFWPMLLITALIAAAWGVVLGVPTLRLRGDYLALVTLGFGEIVPIVFRQMRDVTRGINGIVGIYSPAFPGIDWSAATPVPYYYLIVALILFSIFANVRLRDSRFGRAWIAMRDDEGAAQAVGVNLVRTKLFAFAAGAFFSGVAGAYQAARIGVVSVDTFNFNDSIIYLSMVVIGGIGSIPGVIVGALVVYFLNQMVVGQLDHILGNPASPFNGLYTALIHAFPGFTFGNMRNLIFGAALILMLLLRPEGLIPNARRKRELRARSEFETVEMKPLDDNNDFDEPPEPSDKVVVDYGQSKIGKQHSW